MKKKLLSRDGTRSDRGLAYFDAEDVKVVV